MPNPKLPDPKLRWLGNFMASAFGSFLMGLTAYFRNSLSDPHDTGTVSPWRPDRDWKEALFVAGISFVILFVGIWRAERSGLKKACRNN